VTNASASWPNRIAGRRKIDHGTYLHFFNTSLCAAGTDDGQCAFQVPTGNSYGNSGRSVLYGPGTKNWDVTLQRRVK
jgi:hypothetical protein